MANNQFATGEKGQSEVGVYHVLPTGIGSYIAFGEDEDIAFYCTLNTDQGFQGQFGKMNPPSVPWDHGTPTHFPLLRGAWPYNMPQNYMQQGNASYPPNKPFYPQAGPLMQSNQRFSLLSQGHPHLNMNYIQQKK